MNAWGGAAAIHQANLRQRQHAPQMPDSTSMGGWGLNGDGQEYFDPESGQQAHLRDGGGEKGARVEKWGATGRLWMVLLITIVLGSALVVCWVWWPTVQSKHRAEISQETPAEGEDSAEPELVFDAGLFDDREVYALDGIDSLSSPGESASLISPAVEAQERDDPHDSGSKVLLMDPEVEEIEVAIATASASGSTSATSTSTASASASASASPENESSEPEWLDKQELGARGHPRTRDRPTSAPTRSKTSSRSPHRVEHAIEQVVPASSPQSLLDYRPVFNYPPPLDPILNVNLATPDVHRPDPLLYASSAYYDSSSDYHQAIPTVPEESNSPYSTATTPTATPYRTPLAVPTSTATPTPQSPTPPGPQPTPTASKEGGGKLSERKKRQKSEKGDEGEEEKGAGDLPIPKAPIAIGVTPQNSDGSHIVPVFFGTNRKRLAQSKEEPALDTYLDPYSPEIEFGSTKPEVFGAEDAGELSTGRVGVRVPKSHTLGSVGSSWLKRTFVLREDDRLGAVDRSHLTFKGFKGSLQRAFGDRKEKNVLLFIHGYANTFDDASRRAAQLGFDLNLPLLTAAFSWPSDGGMASYWTDEGKVGPAAQYLVQYLELLLEGGAERIHIVAHSMGNRCLLGALTQIPGDSPVRRAIGNVFLAAPDVDSEDFIRDAWAFEMAQRTTLYISDKDKALQASVIVHSATMTARAGLRPPVLLLDGVDTVDASSVNARYMLAHGYFAEAKPVLQDMYVTISEGSSPADRTSTLRRTCLSQEMDGVDGPDLPRSKYIRTAREENNDDCFWAFH